MLQWARTAVSRSAGSGAARRCRAGVQGWSGRFFAGAAGGDLKDRREIWPWRVALAQPVGRRGAGCALLDAAVPDRCFEMHVKACGEPRIGEEKANILA